MLHEILNQKKMKPRVRNEFRSISKEVLVNLYAQGVPTHKIAKINDRPLQPTSSNTTQRVRRRRRIINTAA